MELKTDTPGTALALFYLVKGTYIYNISTCFAVVQDKTCGFVIPYVVILVGIQSGDSPPNWTFKNIGGI